MSETVLLSSRVLNTGCDRADTLAMPAVGRLAIQYVAERQRLGQLRGESPRPTSSRLALFVDHIGHDTDVRPIPQRRIEAWLLDMDVAAPPRRVRLSAVRTFCAWLVRHGHLRR